MTPNDAQTQIDRLERQVEAIQSDLSNLKTAVYGDATLRILGLLDQFEGLRTEIASLRKDLSELLTWRREMTLLMRVGLGVLSVGGSAQVIALLKAWGI